jgi:pseudouridine-5'-monophosphatase
MGVPGATTGDVFHNWAKLPISNEEFAHEIAAAQQKHFPFCKPLPGAEKLLQTLSRAGIQLALASSTKAQNYQLKISNTEIKHLLSYFHADHQIVGEDPRIQQGRGKPAPDIYLAALKAINTSSDEKPISQQECLVFEDSVAGVEAGRRAGMRVVWVPHPMVAVEYQAREKQVLAGRTGMIYIGDEDQLGELDDGWAETISSLEVFDYQRYGINVRP